ncbi:ABC transporter ATP-binding protein [Kineococcus rhizosphaerae]|uniref:Peptide/nickel transport system ATP-binding protein n=1 Tax=Kineococcus rhizosphaerae TaxID=559628 RepID=A0A2T0QYJ4_9ACTN|nr:ATP-binding cassette domain-containing protein [Kineococcus rhizosphaerae]PRY11198.1 peptide/nickel transport system ATP-binding protein [Kineococcus rhizosphaerae]
MSEDRPASLTQLIADQVVKVYRRGAAPAVAGIDLEIGPDTALGIVGESGSGKSTLARMLAGLEAPTGGRVLLDGEPLTGLLASRTGRRDVRRAIQYIAQDTSSSFDPRRTLRDSVRLPLLRLLGLDRAAADARVDEVLTSLEIAPHLADRLPRNVSGGQRQRFAIARALVVGPRVLICDEVVSALDVSVQGAVLNHLRRHAVATGCGLVFVSHGLPATAFISSHLLVMKAGQVVEHGTVDQVVDSPRHEYTRTLLAAHSGPGLRAAS